MAPTLKTKQPDLSAKPWRPSQNPLPSAAAQPVIDVRHLLDGQREAVLVLDGEAYRLRITAKEKLILTK